MISKLKKTWLVSIFVLIMIAVGSHYISLSARNIVFMDFWRNTNLIVPRVMEGDWPWDVIWKGNIGQRNFFQLFLFAVNVKYTGLNCLWEEYAGIVVIGITSMVLYFDMKRTLHENFNKKIELKHQILFFPVVICLFSLNQWEILSLQFSFAFMLRILGYIGCMIMLNRALQSSASRKRYFLIGCYTGVLILLISQLYWPALVIMLLIVWGVHLFRCREKKQTVHNGVCFWLPVVLAIFGYLFHLDMGNSGGSFGSFLALIKSGDFFKAIFMMLAGSIIPQTTLAQMGQTTVLAIGALLGTIVVLCVVFFFLYNIQAKTYLPMMLCAYGLLSIPIITYGRCGSFDLFYLSASRYCCETNLIWVGCLLTIAYLICENRKAILCSLAAGVIVVLLFRCDYTEFGIAPYRGAYKDTLLSMMQDLDSFSDEELSPFQAGNAQLVRDGTDLLIKYNLNQFRNLEGNADNTLDTVEDSAAIPEGG